MTTNLELRDEPPYNVKLKAENERLRNALEKAIAVQINGAANYPYRDGFYAIRAIVEGALVDVQQTAGEPK